MTITQSQDAPLSKLWEPSAKKLADQGIELFLVNLTADYKAKIVEAYTGADVVFFVTDFWDHMDAQREEDEGKAMIDAAIEAGVKLFIFSALPSPKNYSNGKYNHVYHFESKHHVDEYGKSKNTSSFKYRAVHVGCFNSSVVGPKLAKKDALSGRWSLRLPLHKDSKLPSIDIDGYGLWVRALFENPAVQDDRRPILTVSEWVSMDHIVKTIEKNTGTVVTYEQVDGEAYKQSLPDVMPEHIKADLAEFWAAMDEFGYYGGEDIDWVLPCLSQRPASFTE